MSKIRALNKADVAHLGALYREAFPPDEAEMVADLAVALARARDVISLVYEDGGKVLGHVAFSPLLGEDVNAYILSPLAVDPEAQRAGIGTKLVRAGLERLKAKGVDFVLVYGDPAYYSRFGFDAEMGGYFNVPYEMKYPFGWQGLALGTRKPEAMKVSLVEPLMDARLW